MKAKIILIALLSILTVTCKNITSTTQEIVEIDLLDGYSNVREFNLSDIVSDVSYIKLENHPKAFFSNGTPIIHKGYILIKGSPRDKRLILFDSTGKYIRNIGRSGQGPGEFVVYEDVYFHPHEPKILVHDSSSKKLLIYSVEGECLEEFNYSSLYRHPFVKAFFNQDGDIQVVLRRPFKKVEDFPLVRILDQDFKETRVYHSITNEKDSDGSVSGFSNYWINNGEFYMHDFFFDNVYTQKDNDFFTLFKFNISEKHAPAFYIPRNPGVWVYNSIPFVRSVGKYFLIYAFLPQIKLDGYIPMVYDTQTNQLFRPESPKSTSYYDADIPGINNDVDGFGQIVVSDTWDGKIPDILNAMEVRQTIDQEELNIGITHLNKRQQLIDMVKEMNPEDNSIVRIFTLR